MREKALMAVYAALIVMVGTAILVASCILLQNAEGRSMRITVAEFAARSGLSGDLRRESGMERGPVARAFAVSKKGKVSGFVLLLECGGCSGKARFFGAFSAEGAFKASSPVAYNDAWPIEHGWPSDEVSQATLEAQGGALQPGLVEGMDVYDAETEIFLSGMGRALMDGRGAIGRARSATR